MTIRPDKSEAGKGHLSEKFLMAMGAVGIIAEVIAHPFVLAFKAVTGKRDSAPSLAQRIMGPYL